MRLAILLEFIQICFLRLNIISTYMDRKFMLQTNNHTNVRTHVLADNTNYSNNAIGFIRVEHFLCKHAYTY